MTFQKVINLVPKVAGLALYFIYIVLLVVHWNERPEYNWDMISYIGAAISYEERDISKVHNQAYYSVVNYAPISKHQRMKLFFNPHAKAMAERSDFFAAQLNAYHAKPAYVAGVYALHKLGLNVVFSTRLMAILPAIGLAILSLSGFVATIQSAIAAYYPFCLLQLLEFNRLNFSPHRTCCRRHCLFWALLSVGAATPHYRCGDTGAIRLCQD